MSITVPLAPIFQHPNITSLESTSDLEEGDFTIYEMSSCKNDKSKSKDSLEIIDHYTISKVS
ncbi:MAG TPA: hypothetical protein VLA74_00155 [Nitrososphaeraceae archaeon]|nr:hypothetical protein [Nitrososphaeraceae archaeon]